MVNKEFIKFICEPLGVSIDLFIAKMENDPLTNFFIDYKKLFYEDRVYGKLIQWVFVYFEPVFRQDPKKLEEIKNKDKYLDTLLFLIVPTIHMRFFHRRKDTATPREALQEILLELNVQNLNNILSIVENKEVSLVW